MTPEQLDRFIAGEPLYYCSLSGCPCVAAFRRDKGLPYLQITTPKGRLLSAQIMGETAARSFALNADR